MSQCRKCQEKFEDGFDVCWNCGTARDGSEDPTFRKGDPIAAEPSSARARSDAPPPEREPARSSTGKDRTTLPRKVACRDCKVPSTFLGQIAFTRRGNNPLWNFFATFTDRDAANIENYPIDVFRCPKCGRLDMYDLDFSLPESLV